MALSTAEPALPDRVTEGERERERKRGGDSEQGKLEKEMMEGQKERETSLKRVSVVPWGGQSDAISLSPPSLLHVETAFCHI